MLNAIRVHAEKWKIKKYKKTDRKTRKKRDREGEWKWEREREQRERKKSSKRKETMKRKSKRSAERNKAVIANLRQILVFNVKWDQQFSECSLILLANCVTMRVYTIFDVAHLPPRQKIYSSLLFFFSFSLHFIFTFIHSIFFLSSSIYDCCTVSGGGTVQNAFLKHCNLSAFLVAF